MKYKNASIYLAFIALAYGIVLWMLWDDLDIAIAILVAGWAFNLERKLKEVLDD